LRTISKVIRATCAGLFCAATGCWLVADFGNAGNGEDAAADRLTGDSTRVDSSGLDSNAPILDARMDVQADGQEVDRDAADTSLDASDAGRLYLVPNGDFDDGRPNVPGNSCGTFWAERSTVGEESLSGTEFNLVDGGSGRACEICPRHGINPYRLKNDTAKMKLSSAVGGRYFVRVKARTSAKNGAPDVGNVAFVVVGSFADGGTETLRPAGTKVPIGVTDWQSAKSASFSVKPGELITMFVTADKAGTDPDSGRPLQRCFLIDDVELVPE
jgi:hypothetical protein